MKNHYDIVGDKMKRPSMPKNAALAQEEAVLSACRFTPPAQSTSVVLIRLDAWWFAACKVIFICLWDHVSHHHSNDYPQEKGDRVLLQYVDKFECVFEGVVLLTERKFLRCNTPDPRGRRRQRIRPQILGRRLHRLHSCWRWLGSNFRWACSRHRLGSNW